VGGKVLSNQPTNITVGKQIWFCGKVIAIRKAKDNQNCGYWKGVIFELKEYQCVEVKHHDDVGRTIKEWQKNGWRLHTYQATGTVGMATSFVNHYLLFEKGE
jgi:hypothetical protein